jgi:hypothetical protein
MRGAFIISVLCLFPAFAGAQTTAPSIDVLASMSPAERTALLRQVRDSAGAAALLRDLEMAAHVRADERRARGLPPRSEGCLDADEFDLDSGLKLARQSSSGASFWENLRQYRELTGRLDARLAEARRTNAWRRHFPSLRRWERAWRTAKDPLTRELLLRTLNGQAIRASLARERGPAPHASGKAAATRKPQPAATPVAAMAYREYVFNLMCANDEENLAWFKRQVAEIGWFGQKKYGWAADQAALLIVQHADTDPGFQEAVVASLWPRLEAADTDPENFAYLVDRVAVRAGRPQSFGTQMECVNGAWVVPEIQDHPTLDDRRKRMNLVAYDVQLARTRGMCRD